MNTNKIVIDEDAVKQLCEMLQARFQKDEGYDIEQMADCERTLKVVVTAKQGNVSEFTLVNAVPQRQLSSRAVSLSHAIDVGTMILSIVALCFQISAAVMKGAYGGQGSFSSEDSAADNGLEKWMGFITIALSLIASSKNKVLDKFKK